MYPGMTVTTSFLLFGKKKDIVALTSAARWESGVPISEKFSINIIFLQIVSISCQPLTFSSVFIIKSRRNK
jgi:hypothetical protein